TWVYLGTYPLDKGKTPVVELVNLTDGPEGTVVTADAVKIGGGMGSVSRGAGEDASTSGYPRFTEGARYWLQWAGMPDSVYTPYNGKNDYTDDYTSRALWVNYMAGGSSMVPKREGLNIPIDLSFAFHTDAGTTYNDSIIGSLGIYSTNDNKTSGNGSSRLANRDLTDMVITEIVNDIRANYEPNWTRRGLWDKKYYEARVPEVPSMLLELLSHQNFADMKYGLDPTFRFTVSRAIYKAMGRFIAARDNRQFVVQPLPVKNFAIARNASKQYKLTWAATPDKLEETAMPDYYNVLMRVDNGAFKVVATVNSPEYTFTAPDDHIYSFQIVAGNKGGVSFPSETLALCELNNNRTPVTIVNGFTRVSGPDTFDAGHIAGFYDMRDHGVPYIYDASFIGSQFEFRRQIPWMDDDAAGFGASRANYEEKIVAGNTFDYVYRHGQAIRNAGYSFISTSVGAFVESDVASTPGAIDLILGKQKET
ncbi:MAG: xanthan lyase, partial [Muribaculaceae bacterium]|nr:xanthan lyase [Muribaculaceae bacterium]